MDHIFDTIRPYLLVDAQFRIVEKLKHPHKTTKFIRTHQYTTYVENTYNLQNLKQLLINLQTTN